MGYQRKDKALHTCQIKCSIISLRFSLRLNPGSCFCHQCHLCHLNHPCLPAPTTSTIPASPPLPHHHCLSVPATPAIPASPSLPLHPASFHIRSGHYTWSVARERDHYKCLARVQYMIARELRITIHVCGACSISCRSAACKNLHFPPGAPSQQWCRVLNPSRTLQPFPDICLSDTSNKQESKNYRRYYKVSGQPSCRPSFRLKLIDGCFWEANVREGLQCPGRVRDSSAPLLGRIRQQTDRLTSLWKSLMWRLSRPSVLDV